MNTEALKQMGWSDELIKSFVDLAKQIPEVEPAALIDVFDPASLAGSVATDRIELPDRQFSSTSVLV